MTKTYRRKSAPKDTFNWKVVGHTYRHLWWKFWHEDDIVVPDFHIEPLLALPDDFDKGFTPSTDKFVRPMQYITEETQG